MAIHHSAQKWIIGGAVVATMSTVTADELRGARARAEDALRRRAGNVSLHVAGHSTTIPFRLIDGRIFVRATVNDGMPTDFLLDTGADSVVLTREFAGRRGVPTTRYSGDASGEAGLVDLLTVGALTIRHASCNIRPNRFRLAAALGGEALSPLALGLSLDVDFPNGRLTLASDMPETRADAELPFTMHRVPIVEAVLGGAVRRFIVDTASPVTTIMPDAVRTAPGDLERAVPVRLFDSRGTLDRSARVLLPGPSFQLASLRVEHFPVIVHDIGTAQRALGVPVDGLIGTNFLKAYRVVFDMKRARLRIHRAS